MTGRDAAGDFPDRTRWTSPHPDVEIPDVSLVDFLLGDLDPEHATRSALLDGVTGRRISFGELSLAVDRFAGALSRRLEPGAVVGLMAPNSIEFAVAFLGAIRAGLTVTPINVLSTAEETAHQLEDSRACAVLTVDGLRSVAATAATSAGVLPSRVWVLDDTVDQPGAVTLFGDEPALEAETVPDPRRQVAVLPYSSGTTGQPKGVMLTHRNLVANIAQISGLLGVDRDATVVGVLPFSHIYGMTVVLNLALRRRAMLVTVPRFELEPFLALIEEHRATHLFVAPPIVLALGKSEAVDRYSLDSLELLVSGAAPLDDTLACTVAERLRCQVRQAYGMSEMSPVSHLAPIGAEVGASSVGWTVPNMSCRLLDPVTGELIAMPEVGQSSPGELCCAGPNIMAGYLGRPDATSETIDADGYLHTGDIATVSADGAVTIVDRIKELIKYKGYQVAPAELEGILLTHPDLADAAVVGVVDAATGEELPKAFVVRAEGRSPTAEDVITFVADRVAPYKKVRLVEFIDRVPKSPSGKILRRQLRVAGGA